MKNKQRTELQRSDILLGAGALALVAIGTGAVMIGNAAISSVKASREWLKDLSHTPDVPEDEMLASINKAMSLDLPNLKAAKAYLDDLPATEEVAV